MWNNSEHAPGSAGDSLRDEVRAKYAEAARRAATGSTSCCATPSGKASDAPPAAPAASCCDPITANLYDPAQTSALPEKAVTASLGCGNPTALAQLSPGETVLDLGSGGGIDVLLSARHVAPNGKAYGLDMTDEMLALARENQRKSGIANAEFLKGEIENIPLPEDSVDVVISNCVINLSDDKGRVLRGAFRVLRPGGRFAVSDVVVRDDPRGEARDEARDEGRDEIPAEIRRSMELWIGCIAGALNESEYRAKLAAAGFTEIEIEHTRVYTVNDARQFLSSAGVDADAIAPHVDGRFASAFIRAKKPIATTASDSRRENSVAQSAANDSHAEKSCCGPSCCK